MASDNKTENPNKKTWVSWNENVKHKYNNLYVIHSEKEIVECVKNTDSKIRVFGSKQSSADISAGTPTLLDFTEYNKILKIDPDKKQITVQAGITLAELLNVVEQQGWCIPCLPDINTVTLGGAISTATHGTGKEGKILPQYMIACRLVTASGDIKTITAKDELMKAVRVSIGVLGIFSEITLQCSETYTLHLKERAMKDDMWTSLLEGMLIQHEFVRVLFLPHTNHSYVITGDKIDPNKPIKTNNGPGYLKHRRTASRILYKYTYLFPSLTAIANKILYRLFFTAEKEHKGTLYNATVTKSRGSTMELAEWTVARSKFQDLFKELKTLLESNKNKSYVHIPMDIRFIKQDDSWLSYAYGEDTVTVGCVCRLSDKADRYEAFETVEKLFLKYEGRPHWAKRFKAKKETLAKLYPKFNDFVALRKEMDPQGRFLNDYLKTLFQ